MGKEFLCTGCPFTMVEDHCVKVTKDEQGGGAKRDDLSTTLKWLNISFLDATSWAWITSHDCVCNGLNIYKIILKQNLPTNPISFSWTWHFLAWHWLQYRQYCWMNESGGNTVWNEEQLISHFLRYANSLEDFLKDLS